MAETSRQTSGEVEFTYTWYQDFLQSLLEAGYEFVPFSKPPSGGTVHLRHDVDLSLASAVEQARLEADLGIHSTYFVLLTSPLYNPFERDERERIHEIESLGHDVGLHFSTHEYWRPSDLPAMSAVEAHVHDELELMEALASDPTATVSFHDPPSWVLGREFDGLQSTYAPTYFSDIEYVADSGQRWRDSAPNVPPQRAPLQLLTHPGLWGQEDISFRERIDHFVELACIQTHQRARREIVEGVTG